MKRTKDDTAWAYARRHGLEDKYKSQLRREAEIAALARISQRCMRRKSSSHDRDVQVEAALGISTAAAPITCSSDTSCNTGPDGAFAVGTSVVAPRGTRPAATASGANATAVDFATIIPDAVEEATRTANRDVELDDEQVEVDVAAGDGDGQKEEEQAAETEVEGNSDDEPANPGLDREEEGDGVFASQHHSSYDNPRRLRRARGCSTTSAHSAVTQATTLAAPTLPAPNSQHPRSLSASGNGSGDVWTAWLELWIVRIPSTATLLCLSFVHCVCLCSGDVVCPSAWPCPIRPDLGWMGRTVCRAELGICTAVSDVAGGDPPHSQSI